MKKVVEPFNIHLDAFWEYDLKDVERMIRKLDAETLKKLYGSTINVTDKPMFPHPVTGELMVGDTRYHWGKPYLIILGSKPTPRILYHEVAHYIGIVDEEEAMEFARQKERGFLRMTGKVLAEVIEFDRNHTLAELRKMCVEAGLSPSGHKKELAAKLIARGIK